MQGTISTTSTSTTIPTTTPHYDDYRGPQTPSELISGCSCCFRVFTALQGTFEHAGAVLWAGCTGGLEEVPETEPDLVFGVGGCCSVVGVFVVILLARGRYGVAGLGVPVDDSDRARGRGGGGIEEDASAALDSCSSENPGGWVIVAVGRSRSLAPVWRTVLGSTTRSRYGMRGFFGPSSGQ